MPRYYVRALLLAALLIPSIHASGQSALQSGYDFETGFADQNGGNALTPNGTYSVVPSLTGSGVLLDDEAWLHVPDDFRDQIRKDSSLFLSMDFFLDHGIDFKGARMLVGNKDWAYCLPGFSASIYSRPAEYGQPYLRFNIGAAPCSEIVIQFNEVAVGAWHQLWVHFDFAANEVTVGLDGQRSRHSLGIDINRLPFPLESFLKTLSSTGLGEGEAAPILLGAPNLFGDLVWVDEYQDFTAEQLPVIIDNFSISSPRAMGSTALVSDALGLMSSHLDGSVPRSEAELARAHGQLRTNLDGADPEQVMPALKAFAAAYATARSPLYLESLETIYEYEYLEFDVLGRALFDVGSWLLERGLTPDTAPLAEGIVFEDGLVFPGTVPADAERVQSEVVQVEATFVPDLYYLMAGFAYNEGEPLLSTVFKPTGFYAPAGEVVAVEVDPALVNSGAYLQVGVHNADLRIKRRSGRFPRMHVIYPIESSTVQVVNPLGGGIYLVIPQPVDLGWVELRVTGAVRAPRFIWRDDYKMSEAEWAVQRNYPAPFGDLESESYQISVWSKDLRDFERPDTLMARWDRAMDTLMLMFGRPQERSRAEAWVLDITSPVEGSYPGGYPVIPGIWATKELDAKQGAYSPWGIMGDGVWRSEDPKRYEFAVMLHEMGHSHSPITLEGEREAIVDVPGVAILNRDLGESFEDAMRYGGASQAFTRLDAAIDWMAQENFQAGGPIVNEPDRYQLQYQARARAKYVDLADIFGGWEAMGAIYQTLYEEDKAKGVRIAPFGQEEVSRDKFLMNGSAVLGCNLASLWHFWGIHPTSSAAKMNLASYEPCDGARERVEYYLRNAPRTHEDAREFYDRLGAAGTNELQSWKWDGLVDQFGVAEGQQIRTVGASIMEQYFGVEADLPPTPPAVRVGTFLTGGADVTFSWSPSVDPEGDALRYSWRLFDSQSGRTLLSRNWVADTLVTIPEADLAGALLGASDQIGQEVTTSDVFTIVTGPTLLSDWAGGSATAVDGPNSAPYSASALPNDLPLALGRTTTWDLAAYFSDADGDPLRFSAVSSDTLVAAAALTGSSLSLRAVGAGEATLSLSASDGSLEATHSMRILVTGNRAPEQVAGASTALNLVSGRNVRIDTDNLFMDPEGDVLSVTAVSSDTLVVGVSISGSKLHMTTRSVGTAEVSVVADDGLATNSIVISVSVAANQSPRVVQDQLAVPYRIALTRLTELDPSVYFVDPDGDALTYTASTSDRDILIASVSLGRVLVQAGETLGEADLVIVASDGDEEVTATVRVETYVNTPPVRTLDVWPYERNAMVAVGGQATIDMREMFFDSDGDEMVFAGDSRDHSIATAVFDGPFLTVTGVSEGSVGIAIDGRDGLSQVPSDLGVVVRNNAAPTLSGAAPAGVSLFAGGTVSVSISGIFSDSDGDPLTYRVVSSNEQVATGAIQAESIQISALADGTVTLTLVAFDGYEETSISFDVSVQANALPLAVDDAYELTEDSDFDVPGATGLLANDSDGDGHPLSARIVDVPGHGDLTLREDGGFRYLPQADYFGLDTFTYVADDGYAESDVGSVTLSIQAVNDAPEAPMQLSPEDGAALVVSGDSGSELTISWMPAVDVDGDAVSYRWRLLDAADSAVFERTTSDTLLGLNFGDLAAALTVAGIVTGSDFSGSHEVWASDGVDSTSSVATAVTITRGLMTGLEDLTGIPGTYRLEPNYPNPFNPATILRFGVPEAGPVRVVIYDILGRQVDMPISDDVAAGWHEVIFDASHLASGMYFQVLVANGQRLSRPLLLMK